MFGGKGQGQCPILRLKPTQACQLVLVCPLTQGGMAESKTHVLAPEAPSWPSPVRPNSGAFT